ncbi:MAG: PH domain-containing protein [Saprospiraceae bacterium]|nr:PH domain-containing protein [Saprospiraceae bacterium]
MEEKVIWEGSPSQWTNFWYYVSCILVVPIPVAIWKWIECKQHDFKITEERIIEQNGVFTRKIHDVELYRVKDVRVEQPLIYRMLNLANIIVVSSDRTHPELLLPAIKDGITVREQLRKAVELRRDQKQAREMDFESGDLHL